MESYQFQPLISSTNENTERLSVEQVQHIPLEVTFSLGTSKISMSDANYFRKETLLPLKTTENMPVNILVGGKIVGIGRVEIDREGNVFIRVTEELN